MNPEDEAEAYDNYLFDRMRQYDEDSAHLLLDFRSSLHVVPSTSTHLEEDPSLMSRRTEELWAGLRRVYFGEKEPESSRPGREQNNELGRRVRRRNHPEDSGRPIPPRRDNDDQSPPSVAPTQNSSTGVLVPFSSSSEVPPRSVVGSQSHVPESPSSAESLAAIGSSTKDGQLSVISSCFLCRKLVLLSKKVLRRVMAAKESLFKFGTFVPKNDREAELSPETAR